SLSLARSLAIDPPLSAGLPPTKSLFLSSVPSKLHPLANFTSPAPLFKVVFIKNSRRTIRRPAVEKYRNEQWHTASRSPVDHGSAGRLCQGQQKAARRRDARLEGNQ